MSQFHFSHLFKQAIGTSPYQYLLQQRIERAKQLLKEGDRETEQRSSDPRSSTLRQERLQFEELQKW